MNENFYSKSVVNQYFSCISTKLKLYYNIFKQLVIRALQCIISIILLDLIFLTKYIYIYVL